MTSFWNRFNFRIKHQLYFRMLPVVGLSVLAVGAFSGRLLTSRAVRTYMEQEALESTSALETALERLSIQALLVQVEQEERLGPAMRSAPPGVRREVAGRFLGDLLVRDGVRGAAFVCVDRKGVAEFVACALDSDLAADGNREAVAGWVERRWRGLRDADWLDLATRTGWDDGPRMMSVDRRHSLWIFDPVRLERSGPPSPVAVPEPAGLAAPASTLLLPVTVRDETLPPPGSDVAGHDGRMQIVLLLDIPQLLGTWLDPAIRGELQLALDARGRLLCASADSLAAGLDLTSPAADVLRNVRGEEIAALLRSESADGIVRARLGSRLNPAAVLLARRPELPFSLVSALAMSKINGGLVLYAAIISFMVTIALLGSILAITSVGERLSNRLQAMSHNMEEVAKGDFTRRMGVGNEDEVGRLISYFNQMTADLEEAHQQLSDRTQNLRLALEKMKRLDKAKDDFLALISHEVRTPLTSIIGGIDYMRVVMPPGDTDQGRLLGELGITEIVDIVESSGRRLSEFMNDAILMASLQSADIRAQLGPVRMADLCSVVLSSLQERVLARGLRVENCLEAGAPWATLCDRELMTVALQKLMQNAVQHNVEGGCVRVREVAEVPGLGPAAETIEEKTRREFLEQPELACWAGSVRWRAIEIFNTGPHIPQDRREALFQKFELVGRIEHHQKGSGLSLPIVQAILDNHGGKVHVESLKDRGNFFYLILPTVPAAPEASGEEQWEGERGVAGHEQVGLARDAAGLEVEFQDART